MEQRHPEISIHSDGVWKKTRFLQQPELCWIKAWTSAGQSEVWYETIESRGQHVTSRQGNSIV